MEAYLDNSATTRCYEEVRDIVIKMMMDDYGNPSSMHRKGVEAEKYIKTAAQQIARTLKVSEKEIFFTSGGTESNNWAWIGTATANKRRGNHLITTAIEHPAVSEPAKFLEEQGFRVTRLRVDEMGLISLKELEAAICEETILVSLIYVNNEIGTVQPIEAVGELLKRVNPDICFHVDAVQAYGKYRIFPKKTGIDLLSVSGHKIHGPKGVGFLYVSDRVKIAPLIFGGGQQRGMRSGTDNVPGVSGLGMAAELSCRDMETKHDRIRSLKKMLLEGLKQIEGVLIHGMNAEDGAPHIVSAAFTGVRSEVILHTLEDREIYVSSGSACSTHKKNISPTLTAVGADQKLLDSTIRFSLSESTTAAEIEYTLKVIGEVLPMLRRYTRR